MKEMLGWIHKKMAIQELALRGGKFSTSDLIIIGEGASTCNDPCTPGKDCSIAIRNGSWDNAHISDPTYIRPI
jgi:hypothetical protein